jgi:hypothetical protein
MIAGWLSGLAVLLLLGWGSYAAANWRAGHGEKDDDE